MDKQYVSKNGMEKLVADLNDWKFVKRPHMVKQLQIAREHGDLSENAEYHAAKEELARIDAKIRSLEVILDSSVLVDSSKVNTDQVRLLTRVHIRDEDIKKERWYTLVSAAEANAAEGKISVQSPVGTGLMGHKVGETVEITIPAGTKHWTILEILPI